MEAKIYIQETAMAIASHFAQKGVQITFEKAKELINSICDKDPTLHGQVDIDKLAMKIQEDAGHVGRIAYNEETLARYLEIPLPDLSDITPENLSSHTLYDHVKLEREFQEWLEEWGYEVELGCSLTGLRGIIYIPDVYGKLSTLHGEFEICVSFVCDSPPDEDRVYALLGKIEAYAEAKSTFSYGDIFTVITPHRFTQASINAISLQNEQECYSVFPLEGGDIYVLENAQSGKDRLHELQDRVRQAEEESKTSRIKKKSQDV